MLLSKSFSLMGCSLVLLVAACASEETHMKRRAKVAIGSDPCTAPKAGLNVIGGTTIDAATFPFSKELAVRGGSCSGTFVSSNVYITAAHCVYDDADASNYEVDGVTASKVFYNPAYRNARGLENTDVGVLIFPDKTSTAYALLADRPAHASDEVTLVGFAPNSGNKSIKRKGVNKVSEVASSGMLVLHRENADGALSAPGDSGGTALLDGKLVANMTGGDTESSTELSHLMAEENLSYLRRIRDQEKVRICGLDGDSCNATPPAPTTPQVPTPNAPSSPPASTNPCF